MSQGIGKTSPLATPKKIQQTVDLNSSRSIKLQNYAITREFHLARLLYQEFSP